jgi:hypothetical protein
MPPRWKPHRAKSGPRETRCCSERRITNGEYQSLREDVHRFAVVPGHERLDIERIVERHTGYLVVEKTDPDAAEIAEKTA